MTKADFYLHDLASKYRKIDPKKYYLSYSGGKDSHLLFWFQKTWLPLNYPDLVDYNIIPIVSVNTRMEWPEIVERMQKNSDVILIPKLKPHEVIAKYGTPCFSKFQDDMIHRYQNGGRSSALMERINGKVFTGSDGKEHNSSFSVNGLAKPLLLDGSLPRISPECCNQLKKKPMKIFSKESGLLPILGVSGQESRMRKVQYHSCFTKSGKFTPLWDLTEEIENEIYEQFNIETPSIYHYINQTGCAGCPYGIGLGHTEKELALMTPAKKKYVCELFKDAYRIRHVNIHKPLQTVLADYIQQYEEGKE